MAGFYSARSETIPPLPWPNFAPPFPPVIVDEIERTLRLIKEQGITTVIVEQNAVRALELADRAVILDTGSIVFDGSASEVLENESLRAEYLAI